MKTGASLPLPKHDSIIEAGIWGLFISISGAVAGGLLAAMLLGLVTLDVDGAAAAAALP